MRKRNILIGAASFAVASLAIGGGAVVSSAAMAASTATPKATVTIVTINGADAVSCTFVDIDLAAAPAGFAAGSATADAVPSGPAAPADPGGATVQSVIIGLAPDGAVPPDGLPLAVAAADLLPQIGGGQVVAGSIAAAASATGSSAASAPATGSVVVNAAFGPAGAPAPPVGLSVIGVDGSVTPNVATRQGTADECAAMRSDLPHAP